LNKDAVLWHIITDILQWHTEHCFVQDSGSEWFQTGDITPKVSQAQT